MIKKCKICGKLLSYWNKSMLCGCCYHKNYNKTYKRGKKIVKEIIKRQVENKLYTL